MGQTPRYEEFPEPALGDDEIRLRVKAVALENVDKAMARGAHYASRQFLTSLPAIVGSDGIGMLDDGRLVGFGGMRAPYGAMAERATIPKTYYVPIPDGVDAAVAAAVPGSTLASLLPLKLGARLEAGETVLVNGATGFAGRLAVQVAKLIGAGRVVATGRDDASLRALPGLGADSVIDLKQSDARLIDTFKKEAGASGYQVILDFLWGHPTEMLVAAFVPKEISFARTQTRLVQIGAAAGPRMSLPADALRTSGLTVMGAGGGMTPEGIAESAGLVWEWIKDGKLQADIERAPLKDIARAWKRADTHGARIVIVP